MLQKRERDSAVDFVRVISMLSVVCLHATSAYIFAPCHYLMGGLSPAFIINQGVRYCVPLFFLLSGLSLELSFRPQSYGTFVLTRAKKIVLPYLFWTTLYYIVLEEYSSWSEFMQAILWGKAAPHLYFIVALVQLYLLYIPLRYWLKRKPYLTLGVVFLTAFLTQWALYLMVFQVQLFPILLRPYMVKTFVPWMFCFLLGILLAQTSEKWKPLAYRYRRSLLLATMLFAVFYVLDSAATKSFDLSVKPLLFFYVPLVFFCLYGLGKWCADRTLIRRGIEALSQHSMTVFFCHIWVLVELRERVVLEGSRGMLLLCAMTVLFSLLFAVVFDALIIQAKKLLRLFGDRRRS